MTDEQKRICIAEACGWKPICPDAPEILWTNGKDHVFTHELPDFLNDLNAMHHAEKTLTREQCYLFQEHLCRIEGDWCPKNQAANWLWHATARQRADAFLLTLGKL